MNPKVSAYTSEKKETNASPFQQVADRENQEEARVRHTLESLKKEEEEADKAMKNSEKHTEEKLRTEAKKQLMEYKEELSEFVRQAEGETQDELVALKAAYEKNMPKVAARQAEEFYRLSL